MKAYDNYIFDLYGTLVDIHTEENDPLVWKKLALFYGYYDANYAPEELKERYAAIIAGEESKMKSEKKDDAHEAHPEVQIEEVFQKLFEEKDFSINLEKVSIFSDADMLQQVWINLIDNAIKYSGDNCKIDISVKRLNDKSVAVSISDNGIGIEEKKLHKIFDKFYQCEESHKKSGSGLGLSISKRIIELLNGTIECKSKKDFGTTMVVTLFI